MALIQLCPHIRLNWKLNWALYFYGGKSSDRNELVKFEGKHYGQSQTATYKVELPETNIDPTYTNGVAKNPLFQIWSKPGICQTWTPMNRYILKLGG